MQEQDAYIAIYDDNGHVIDKKIRKEVNKRTDTVKQVTIMVTNSKNEMFITRPKNAIFSDPWGSSAAGLVRFNESDLDAAKRTFQREIGLNEELNHIKDNYYVFDGVKRYSSIYYIQTDTLFSSNEKDVYEGKWETLEFIEKNIGQFMPTFRVAFNAFKSKRNQ